MDRLQAIEIFVKVAELGSFTSAAEELKLSRTVVSDRVKDLEGRLGVRLLQRTTRRVALTEPGAGSDLTGLAATAVRDGDGWMLNGEKWFVTSEGDPGVYIVLAVAEGEQTLFLVDPRSDGLEIRRTPSFLHDPYLDHHPEIVFRDCRVPDAHRVPASGDAGAKEWILVERLFIAARCCGAALRLVDLTAEWAQEREAFGSPIAEYQGVTFPLADSAMELHAAHLMALNAAMLLDRGERAVKELSMAKAYAVQAGVRAVDRAMQAHGAMGFTNEVGLTEAWHRLQASEAGVHRTRRREPLPLAALPGHLPLFDAVHGRRIG